METRRKIVFVASGGGVRAFAHIGALKACFERGLMPDEYVGTSAGAIVCAFMAAGMSLMEVESLGRQMNARHVLDYNYGQMFSPRKAKGIVKGARLQRVLAESLPVDDFRRMKKDLFINTAELSGGYQVIWGQEGFDDVPVHQAVYASCAIPGVFEPIKLRGGQYVDGGLVDNLPIQFAVARDADLIVAVNLGFSAQEVSSLSMGQMNLIGIIAHSGAVMMQSRLRLKMRLVKNAPFILVEPKLRQYEMFDFGHFDDFLLAGYEAACAAFDNSPLLRDGRIPD